MKQMNTAEIVATKQRELAREGSLTLTVRVHPRARAAGFTGTLTDGTWKFDLRSTPEDGAANVELCVTLAKLFGLPRGNVTIIAGETSRRKIVRLQST